MTSSDHVNSANHENFRNARLLVIEDNADHGVVITSAIQQCLPEVKLIVTTTENEAHAYLDQCEAEEWVVPRLVLLDLYLPDPANGWRVLEHIKNGSPVLTKIPVVLLSSSNSRCDITAAYDRGCASYLVKPGRFDEWIIYFQMLRTYWWETVTLPKPGISQF